MPARGSGNENFNNRFALPAVAGIEVTRVRFERPRRFYSEGRPVEKREAIQFLVRTVAPLPARDVTPVIFIGETQVGDYEQVGSNLYRFLAYELEELRLGAPIALGWPFAPEMKLPTNFLFNLKPPLIA